MFLFLSLFQTPTQNAIGGNDISVKVTVDHALMTIGDQVNFQISVVHAPEIEIFQIDTQDALSDFEIKSTKDFSTKKSGEVTEGKNIKLTSFELGEYVIRPCIVTYRTQNGKTESLKTDSLYVTVQSVDQKADPKSDIRGLKGVVDFHSKFWILFFITIVVLGISGILILWYQKSRLKTSHLESLIPVLSPHEEAYKFLHQLKNSDLLKKGRFKSYFSGMSEVLRRYLERRYEFPALESTTIEVTRALKEKGIASEQRELIRATLEFCDFVKFAKYTPSVGEVLEQDKKAFQIVDQTKKEIILASPVKDTP